MGIKGSRHRVSSFKRYQDNAEESGIPDLSLRNVDTEDNKKERRDRDKRESVHADRK